MPETDAPMLCPIPHGLAAPGAETAPFRRVLAMSELAPGEMRRASFGDLDLLVASTSAGIVVTDDRCPHMAAPLSIGTLDGCVVACVLHGATFDLSTGLTVEFPTTGGLDPGGLYHPPRVSTGGVARPEPPVAKARARALTRTRHVRYYPARIRDGQLEARIPAD